MHLSSQKKPSILFMGTPEFGHVILEGLFNAGYPIVGIVTQPDRPSGRGQKLHTSPCALFAKAQQLTLYQPSSLKDQNFCKAIQKIDFDFIITAAYGLFLPESILALPIIDILNVHPSLLPQYRGAAPIQWALLDGQTTTGITILRTIKKMDAGPVFIQQKIDIQPGDNNVSLSTRLAQKGAELLVEHLPQIATGKMKPFDQNESQVVLAPLLKKEDGSIEWNQSALKIHNLIRALNPWPSAYTSIDNKTLKIYDSLLIEDQSHQEPGTIYLLSPKGIHIACKDSSLLLTLVQLEGKKRMTAADFVRGYRLKEGIKLGKSS